MIQAFSPYVQGGATGLDTGNVEKLSNSQATPARQAAWLLLSFSPLPVSNHAAFSTCITPTPRLVECIGGCALKRFFHCYLGKLKSWFLGPTNAEFHADLKNDLIFGIYAFWKPWEAFEVWTFEVNRAKGKTSKDQTSYAFLQT